VDLTQSNNRRVMTGVQGGGSKDKLYGDTKDLGYSGERTQLDATGEERANMVTNIHMNCYRPLRKNMMPNMNFCYPYITLQTLPITPGRRRVLHSSSVYPVPVGRPLNQSLLNACIC